MSHFLITGGCGFIGSHLVEHLLSQGHQLRILDDLSTGKVENLPANCKPVVGDVTDADTVAQCMEGVDGCFHLAAVASVQRSNEQWPETHRINLTGTINVLDAARARKTPVVYASSAAVYGDNAEIPLTENSAARPLTAYGADKLGSELHARVASVVHGVPTTGLRFFNVYGPRQDPHSPYSGVISIFADRILRGLDIATFGDGEQTRDFVYVKDVVFALQAAMERIDRNPSVFNVCTGRSVSVNQLAKTLMSVTGAWVEIERKPVRKGDIRTSVGSPSVTLRSLGVGTRFGLTEGLRCLVDYRRKQLEGASDIDHAA